MAALYAYCLLTFIYFGISTCFLFDRPVDDTLACNTTNYLRDSSIRDAKHQVIKNFICDDNLSPGWYRFEKGEIATSCVPGYHCSRSTIWMDDTIPSVQDGMQEKKFCVNFVIDRYDPDCCDWTYNINVKNCGNFLAYYLGTDSMTCPMAYCTGDIKLCGPGMTSTTGFEPCTDSLPQNLSPQLHGPRVTASDYYFDCIFSYTTSSPTLAFNVTWRFDDVPVSHEIIQAKSHRKSVSSSHSLWVGHFGKQLSCSVQPFSVKGTTTIYGQEEKSTAFWGGIKIDSKNVVVTEGRETDVGITSTLPILCKNNMMTNCSLQLFITVDRGVAHIDEPLHADRCYVTLAKNNLSTSIQLSIPLNPVMYSAFKHSIELSVHDNDVQDVWAGYRITFPVTTRNALHADCLLFPNGHIFGFEKKDLYTMNYPGDYLVYQSEMDSDRTLVVHARHKVLSRQLSSMCGVAMQYGPDIVYLDMCEYDSVPIITMNNTDSKLTIYECGPHEYHVYTDDIHLEVQLYDLDIAIKLHLPPSYSIQGQGLCSFTDPAGKVNLALEDIKSYRLGYNDSFFGLGKLKNHTVTKTMAKSYCTCESVRKECHPGFDVTDILTQKNCTAISVNSTNAYKKESSITEYPGSFHPRPFSWPTPSGRTEYNTLQECQGTITTFVPHLCLTEIANFLTKFYEVCLNDVKVTDSLDSRLAIAQAFTWLCQISVLTKSSSYQKHGIDVIPPPELTSELCPRFCSFNGTCQHGVCQCHTGHRQNDCTGSSLENIRILGGLTCTGLKDGCLRPTLLSKVPLRGNQDFVNVTPFFFVEGKRVPLPEYGQSFLHTNMEYSYALSVDLSDQRLHNLFTNQTAIGFTIFLMSANGLSNRVYYVIYDEKCRLCYSDQIIMCTLKEDACHIDNKCYSDGEINPLDNTKKCDSLQSILQWSNV